ncbi:MAG: polysaccharide export protein [Sphingomonas sp.]|nr:polysaccharide export protein [Sphingomonas sp.]
MSKPFAILAALAATSACAGSVDLDKKSTAVVVADTLPLPDVQARASSFADYRIGPNDEIEVTVFGVDEMTRRGTVDTAGNFSMPLAGAVMAGGKTPDELANLIEDKLRGRYLKDPQVAVNIVEVRANLVTIDGAVRQPGIYPIIGTLTLQQAVATARGASDTADLDTVIVFRQAEGQRMAAKFDLKDIRSGRMEDPIIFANDIVVVGESATARFLRDLRLTVPTLGTFVPVL